jgi:uncharacterized membrane protein
VRREAAWEYLKGALWALPSVAVLLALVAGSVLASIELPQGSPFDRLLFQGTSDDARTLLIGIASTMITVIALVLGLTVVALQLSSTQYSPRLLHSFVRDRVNQVVLSVFVATFTYSTAGLYTVGISEGRRTDDFPRLAVTGALVLLFACLLMLVFFVHHLVHSIQVDEVMRQAERHTLHVIEHDLPTEGVTGEPVPEPPVWAVALPSYSSGYVQRVHPEVLLRSAVAHDVTLAGTTMVGEHVIAGSPLVWAWRASPEQAPPDATELTPVLRDSIRVGFERTMEQDAAFGVRQLADIGTKAVSPAVNDPYTAVQAVQHLAVVLAALVRRPLGSQLLRDPAGSIRVVVPARDLGYYRDLACAQIRRSGARDPRVMRALLRGLHAVAGFTTVDADRAMIAEQVRLVLAESERAMSQPADLEPVRRHADAVLRAVAG